MSDERLEMLERENAELRERIAFLEAERGSALVFPAMWRLTSSEQRILALLLSRGQATREQLLFALERPGEDADRDIKIVDVFVCKIRAKMKPFGLLIRTLWGRGYVVDEPYRSDIRRQLEPPTLPTRMAS